MISKIWSFINTMQLTIQQWITLSMAAIIGVLTVLLGLQGSRLHKAQIELLLSNYFNELNKQDGDVEAAKAKYDEVVASYNKTRLK